MTIEADKDMILTEQKGRVLYATLNRPKQLNALCWPLMDRLMEVLKTAEKDPDVGVIILRGTGRCFSAGYDFQETPASPIKPGEGPATGDHEPRGVPQYGRGVWNSRAHVQDHINYDMTVFNLWKPVIAQVHGFAYAGASTLALACDLTIMASDAKIGYPPTRWLATGDNVGIYSFLAGMKKAREMSYGRMFNGVECADIGLANYHFPEAELEARTLEIAQRIASIEPELLMLNKMVVNRTWEMMGFKTAMEIAGEFDTICHLANTARPMVDAMQAANGNLGAALKKLNEPLGRHVSHGVRIAREGDVIDIVLDRPQRRNALGGEEWKTIDEALDAAAAEKVGIIRLSGTGPVFCGGVDLDMIRAAQQRSDGMIEQIRYVGGIVEKLERSNAIVIAALNGPAIGIGVHLALCADFILATKDAYLWLPEASLGIPDVQHHRLLTERLGRGRSFAFGLLGEKLGPAEACSTGTIYKLLEDHAELDIAMKELSGRLQNVGIHTRLSFKRQAAELMSKGSIESQLAAIREVRGNTAG